MKNEPLGTEVQMEMAVWKTVFDDYFRTYHKAVGDKLAIAEGTAAADAAVASYKEFRERNKIKPKLDQPKALGERS